MLSCHADVSIINTFQCGSMPGIAWLAATVTIDHFLECLPTVVCPCCCLWMPCASLRVIYLPESSHQALSSLITRPSVLSSCNWLRLQLFSFAWATPAPIIQLCLSVWLFFSLTPSGSQVNAWSLSRTAYKCKTLRSNELTSSANSTSKQYHNALLPCWCVNN